MLYSYSIGSTSFTLGGDYTSVVGDDAAAFAAALLAAVANQTGLSVDLMSFVVSEGKALCIKPSCVILSVHTCVVVYCLY